MPAAVLHFRTAIEREFCVLELARPGMARVPVGIVLRAPDGIMFRLRDDWEELDLDEQDLDYLALLETHFSECVREMGSDGFLFWMEDTLSNYLTLSAREPAGSASLDDIYARLVDDRVRPYDTHLPVYTLAAAATKFGEDSEVEAAGWRRVEGLRLEPGMFIARVVGRSMEPLIADGSWCVFRAPVVGSRQGKRLLIEQFGATDSSARYTVKRYISQKRATGEDEWEHTAIRLEPLNPEFESFELAGGQFRVIAEFLRIV